MQLNLIYLKKEGQIVRISQQIITPLYLSPWVSLHLADHLADRQPAPEVAARAANCGIDPPMAQQQPLDQLCTSTLVGVA